MMRTLQAHGAAESHHSRDETGKKFREVVAGRGAEPKKSRNLIGSEVGLFRKGDVRLCVIHRT